MMVVEYEGRIVVVDTGLRFPTTDMLGIDLVLPDFTYLRERADDIEAIVITHGHEDHLGALPWVLRELGGDAELPPVYGGPLTIAMAHSKLDEHNLRDADLEDVAPGERRRRSGPFALELIHMTHSIPDSCAVAVADRARDGADDRRLQVRPDPGRRRAGRYRAAGRARQRGRAAAVRRLDQRRPARLLAVRARGRPAPRGGVRPRRGPDHRHQLRLQHPPRPAGASTPPPRSGARSRWSAARCARTSTSAARSATSRFPRGC